MHPLRAVLVLCFAFLAACTTTAPNKSETPVSSAHAAPNIEPELTLVAPIPGDVWDVVRSGLALEHEPIRPSVARAISAYLTRDSLMPALQTRAGHYFAYIVEAVRQRNLPMELALLPIVESTLNPYALSRSGAAGLWQLVPATAKQHGVTIDWWYDGRRDVLDSTSAALDYLTYLHAEFGDWLLAIAAYNGGEGRVKRALASEPSRAFFDLKLPRETQRYIPQVLALAHLIAADNSFVLPPIAIEAPFFVATIDDQIDLGTLTRGGALPIDELFTFNPGLNRRATPPDRPYRMVIPSAFRAEFESALNAYPPRQAAWQHHRVKPGESLSAIAKRYHTTVAAIRVQNGLASNLIHPNQSLLVPYAAIDAKTLAANPWVNTRGHWQQYKTRSGDSLWSISRRFNTSIRALARTNQLDAHTPLTVGQILIVPGHSAPNRVTYSTQARTREPLDSDPID